MALADSRTPTRTASPYDLPFRDTPHRKALSRTAAARGGSSHAASSQTAAPMDMADSPASAAAPRLQVAFEGGGANFLPLLETAQALQEQEAAGAMTITRVAGTSAGALVAAVVAAGIDAGCVKQVLRRPAGRQAFLSLASRQAFLAFLMRIIWSIAGRWLFIGGGVLLLVQTIPLIWILIADAEPGLGLWPPLSWPLLLFMAAIWSLWLRVAMVLFTRNGQAGEDELEADRGHAPPDIVRYALASAWKRLRKEDVSGAALRRLIVGILRECAPGQKPDRIRPLIIMTTDLASGEPYPIQFSASDMRIALSALARGDDKNEMRRALIRAIEVSAGIPVIFRSVEEVLSPADLHPHGPEPAVGEPHPDLRRRVLIDGSFAAHLPISGLVADLQAYGRILPVILGRRSFAFLPVSLEETQDPEPPLAQAQTFGAAVSQAVFLAQRNLASLVPGVLAPFVIPPERTVDALDFKAAFRAYLARDEWGAGIRQAVATRVGALGRGRS